MFWNALFVLVLLAAGPIASADTAACDILVTPKDVIQCVLRNHPDLQRSRLAIEQSQSLTSVAAQIPNPVLGSRGVFGSALGDDASEVELDLTQTIELGGKRSARIDRSRAQQKTVQAGAAKTQQEVVVSTLESLYRLRQLKSEMRILDEALDTFRKIQRLYRSRPKLAAEQDVSLAVFQLAGGDYRLRKVSLENEEETLRSGLALALGRDLPESSSYLPKRYKAWPQVAPSVTSFRGPLLLAAQAELADAQAEYEAQKSLSWPDLSLGPSLKHNVEGAVSYIEYGFNLSFTLPIWNLNGAGRTYGSQGVQRAERNISLLDRQVNSQRQILVRTYEKIVQSLQESLSTEETEQRHKKTEAWFERGLVSSPLVIEAHRQLVDFNKSQNEQELKALQALWQILAIDGTLLEVNP